jgi:hypothetical protein
MEVPMSLPQHAARAWILISVSLAAVAAVRGEERSDAPQPPPARPAAPVTEPMPVAEAEKELGAAAWVPADAGYYSGTLRLHEQLEAVARSRAYQRILAMPVIGMGLMQMRGQPAYRAFLELIEKEPLAAQGLDVAADAFSTEVFFHADARAVPFVAAVLGIYLELVSQGLRAAAAGDSRAPEAPLANSIVREVLFHEKDLRCPPLIAGFRLARPEAARELIVKLLDRFGKDLPVPVRKESVAEGEYHTLQFDGRMLPGEFREEVARDLKQAGVPEDTTARFSAFLESQTLAVSAGLRGNYLLLSIGPDLEHLKKLGGEASLARSPAFAPVRRRLKPGVVSLSYVHPALASSRLNPAGVAAYVAKLLAVVPAGTLPEGFAPRLDKDLRSLVADVNGFLPEDGPRLSVTFLNRGYESFTFAPRVPFALDPTRPLAIAERAGSAPLGLLASRSPPSREAYLTLTRWLQTAYGYFLDYAAPRIPEADRQDFLRFEKLFLPALKEIHTTTESLLFPAIDGGQRLITLDGGGSLASLPGAPEPLSRPLRYPRPALVFEVKDAEKLRGAFRAYRQTANRLLAQAAKEFDLDEFQIPEPASRPHAGGTLYTYPLPASLGPDLEPHALVLDGRVVIALSPAQSQDIAEAKTPPVEGAVKLGADAGLVYRLQVAPLARLLIADAGIVLAELGKHGVVDQGTLPVINFHLHLLGEALGAFKSWSGRVTEEEGLQVSHSWLEIEDLPE